MKEYEVRNSSAVSFYVGITNQFSADIKRSDFHRQTVFFFNFNIYKALQSSFSCKHRVGQNDHKSHECNFLCTNETAFVPKRRACCYQKMST